MIRTSIWIIALSLSTLTLIAQDTPVQKRDDIFTIPVDVELVQVPVSVLDRDGRIVDGLSIEHFQLFENKVQQEISRFRHEDIPISLGLVIDNSGSMKEKRERVNTAALSFVRESNPEDETFIVNFDSEAYLEQDFTGSLGDLVDALDNIDTRGETAVNDAIYLAVEKVQTGRMDKKALLVISDGEDTASKFGYNKLLEFVKGSKDVTIFAVGLLEENDQRGGIFRKSPSKLAKEQLTQIAEITGGQAYFPKSVDEVEEICRRIAHDLRNQYTLEYSPKNKNLDGTWRAITIEVNPPRSVGRVETFYKEGYFAPGPTPTSSR